MDFHNYVTVREVCERSGGVDAPMYDCPASMKALKRIWALALEE